MQRGEDGLKEKFGGMYRVFHYGPAPHSDIAPGTDRIVKLLCGEQNLREVVLFPMNQQTEDLTMGVPSKISMKRLRELSLRLNVIE
jgi:aspartyl-tRNA synthetase